MAAALLVLVVVGVLYLGVRADNTLKQTSEIGKPTPTEHQISVEGVGHAYPTPDLATLTLSVETHDVDVPTAQSKNTATMNAVIDQVKALGITDADVQTSNYSVYEDQVWNPDTQTYDSKGWVVSQQITVKVRQMDNVAKVLAVAGANGITNVTGPDFSLENPSAANAQARAAALAEAKQNAADLAQSLGIPLDTIVGYTEWTDASYPPQPYLAKTADASGTLPSIEPGTNEVVLHVSLTYKLAY